MSIGWINFDTPAFHVLASWYTSMGSKIKPVDDKEWGYGGLVEIERKLGGKDYEQVFQIE